jgi:SAM-dependent methyltransferase
MRLPTCKICGNTAGNRMHVAREMMFGTRDRFEYLECRACGTLQLSDVPDLSRYYRDDYYAFNHDLHFEFTGLKRRLGAWAVANYYGRRRNRLGRHLAATRDWAPRYFPPSMSDHTLGITTRSRILDVGCGAGLILLGLREYGFRKLVGVDPYIDHDISYPNGVRVLKRSLDDMSGPFDVVMFHHSFEHLADPRATLRRVHEVLVRGSCALIRMPVVGKAWRDYGVDWFQLDAPRHLFLFSEQGFRDLATSAGFVVEGVTYDSTELQFWVSEQYRHDIPLFDHRSYYVDPEASMFTPDQISSWIRQADSLNAAESGDQAAYYLRKS